MWPLAGRERREPRSKRFILCQLGREYGGLSRKGCGPVFWAAPKRLYVGSRSEIKTRRWVHSWVQPEIWCACKAGKLRKKHARRVDSPNRNFGLAHWPSSKVRIPNHHKWHAQLVHPPNTTKNQNIFPRLLPHLPPLQLPPLPPPRSVNARQV